MEQIILFTFLTLFPFGQIIRIGIIQPLDIVVGIGAVWAIVKKLPKPKIFTYFQDFLLVAAFSWVFGAAIFWQVEVFYGLLYLIRLAAYFYFLILVSHFRHKKLLLNSLLAVVSASAIFGWIQYFWWPDLRPLLAIGWDEHYYRLVGTFLDPGYLALILVFGIILAFFKQKYFLLFFLLLTLAFTYSRAGYLAFFAALIPMWFFSAKTRVVSILALSLLSFILFLPRPGGEGVKLERVTSIVLRIANYRETFSIFKTSPVFGAGYNNLCLAKGGNFSSHSCSGSDSSLLFILATTGLAGFIYFIYLVLNIFRRTSHTTYYILHTTAVALVTHSFFSNSIFYPWILGWLIVLLGSEVKR